MATMFICSVNTILFNANPLLRYDGYYVMADWLEIPNLRIKSTQFFAYLFQEKVLGLEVPVQSYMPRSRRSLFVIYAIASYLYRWVVTFSILFFLYQFLKPYKLGSISAMMAIGSLVPLVGMPVYQMVKFVRTPGRMRKVKKARAAALRGGRRGHRRRSPLDPDAAAGPGDAGPDGGQAGRDLRRGPRPARRAGSPRRRLGQEGHLAGHPLEPREGPRADAAPGAARRQLRQGAVVRRQPGPRQPRPSRGSTSRWPGDLEPAIDKVVEQVGKLTLVAPRDGQAMGVPQPETIGQYLKPGKPFCEIGDPHQLEAHLILDQSDIDLVKLNKHAPG